MRPSIRILAGLAVASVVYGQTRDTHEKLHAALWAQTAREYRGAALQAYRVAREQLDRALADSNWTAAVEQTGQYRELPPALIVDIDETILDNSPSQARMIRRNAEFGAVWEEWVSEARAEPIPGALEFLQYAWSRGVTVFYITNRNHSRHEEATRRNLTRAGFPLSDHVDVVLTAGEKPDWSSDKSSRRTSVASHYRVLLLVGDDLGDFLPGVRTSVEKRAELARPYDAFWGWKWILIPNAAYGSWEEAHYGFDRSMKDEEKLSRKKKALRE
ncbi:MAG: 5'-nucleotidase, lipoprotein e(P4) family [Bryobacteraceae bacterium]